MSFRSRLSAAWKAFKRYDFPPSYLGPTPLRDPGFVVRKPLSLDSRDYEPVRLDLKATTYNVHPPVDMSPHPLPTIVDETEAIHAEEQRELSKLTPDSNVEVPAVIRKRRKKLESVKK